MKQRTKKTDAGEVNPELDVLDELVVSYQQGDLAQILTWWKEQRTVVGLMEARPEFRGDLRYKSTGIRVREEILARAMKKAKRQRLKSGGSISSLVELLLWEYIGSPADLLAAPSPPLENS
jgi:hypothetical protein